MPVRLRTGGQPPTTGTDDPYDRGRHLEGKAVYSSCYAATTSMYLDQFGNVRACCQNTGTVLGNVTDRSLREIWESADAERLRSALERRDFSEGCGFCGWQVDQGDLDIVFARSFDVHPVTDRRPPWPVQMEFSMTNSCNLQCVMCNGDWSSSIRTHREHRAPLPEVYGERFFSELEEFLPHLHKANFLGGEPFLGKEPLRVLSMLAHMDEPPVVAVTTNGTQWSPRIERICEQLPISFVLSLDGITRSTYESIRVGADFGVVMRNLDRFQQYAATHGTTVSLAHCLMRSNWREFSLLLRFAEERELSVGVNEVLFPADLSLFQLPVDGLSEVVTEMERDEGGVAASLTELRPVWDGQVRALRHRLEVLEGGSHTFVRPWPEQRGDDDDDWEAHALRILTEWCGNAPLARIELPLADGHPTVTTDGSELVDRLKLPSANRVDEILARLSSFLGSEAPPSRRYTDMLDDVVVADPRRSSAIEFRVVWNSSSSGATTLLLAGRNLPSLPDDPHSVMTAWCGAERTIIVHSDEHDTITGATATVARLGVGDEQAVIGLTTTELLERVSQLHDSEPRIAQGPSGYLADTLASLVDGSGATRLRLRVMSDRSGGGNTLVVGIDPAVPRDTSS